MLDEKFNLYFSNCWRKLVFLKNDIFQFLYIALFVFYKLPFSDGMDDDTRSETSTHSSKGIKRASMIKKQRESFEAADVKSHIIWNDLVISINFQDDLPARKKPKKSELIADSLEQIKFSPTSGAAPEPERVSRSGRKIKPKRFLDEEVSQEEELRESRKSLSDEIPKKMAKPNDESKKVATVAPIDTGKRSARNSSTDTKKDKSPMVR